MTKGYSESALRFSDTGDSVKFADSDSFDSLKFVDEITVEAWIKPDKPTQQACFVAKDDNNGAHDYSLGINAEGELSFAATVDGKLEEVTSSFAMLAGTWYHIAGTFDGSAVRIFVNGNEDGEKEVKGKLSKTAKNLTFARSSSDTARPFAGTIDEVRLWAYGRDEMGTDEKTGGQASVQTTYRRNRHPLIRRRQQAFCTSRGPEYSSSGTGAD